MVERYKSDAQYKPGMNPYRYAEGITTPAAPRLTPPPPAPNLRRPRTTPGLAKAQAAKQEGSQLTQMLSQWSDTLYEQAAEKIAIEAEAEGIEAGNHRDPDTGELIPPELDTNNISVRSTAYYNGQMAAYKSATQTDVITTMGRLELENSENEEAYIGSVEAYRSGMTDGLTGKNKLFVNSEINTRAARSLVKIRERALDSSRKHDAAAINRNAKVLTDEIVIDSFNGDPQEAFIKYAQLQNSLQEGVASGLLEQDDVDKALFKLQDDLLVQTLKGTFVRTIKNEGLAAAEAALKRFEEAPPDEIGIRVSVDRDGDFDPDGEETGVMHLTPALRERLIREAKTEISSARSRAKAEQARVKAGQSAVDTQIKSDLTNIENTIKNGMSPPENTLKVLDQATIDNPTHRARFMKWSDIHKRVKPYKSMPLREVEAAINFYKSQGELGDLAMRSLTIIEKVYKARQAKTTGDNRTAVGLMIDEMKTLLSVMSPGNPELKIDKGKLEELLKAVEGTDLYQKLTREKSFYEEIGKALGLPKDQRVAMMDAWERSKESNPYTAELFARLEPLHNQLIAEKETEIAAQVGHMKTALLTDKKIEPREWALLEDAARNTKYEKPLALARQKHDMLNQFQMLPVVAVRGGLGQSQASWLLEKRGEAFGSTEAEVVDHIAAWHSQALNRIKAGDGLGVAVDMGLLDANDLPAMSELDFGAIRNFSNFLTRRADAAMTAEAGIGPRTEVGLEADFDPEAETDIPGREGGGFDVPALRPAEVDRLVEHMTAVGPEQQLMMIEAMVESLGTSGAQQIFGQFDKKGAIEIGMAGVLMTDGAPSVAREVLIGRTQVNAPFMPEHRQLRLDIMQELATAMPPSDDPRELEAMVDTVVASMAYKAFIKMGQVDSRFNPKSFRDKYGTDLTQAINDVTGGIITVDWDESSGGRDLQYRILAPRRGWIKDDWVRARRAITPEHIEMMGGLSEHHDAAEVLKGIRGSVGAGGNQGSIYKFVPAGGFGERGNGYWLLQSGNEKYIANKNGGLFVFRFPEGKYWPDKKNFFGFN